MKTPQNAPFCIKSAKTFNLSLFIVDRTYVFNRRSTLNDRSAVALVTVIVNMIHKMVSIEGYSTGFTASSVSQSEVGIWSRGVILQRVRLRAISLLNSSKLHVRSVSYVSYNVAICSFVIFPITRGSRYCDCQYSWHTCSCHVSNTNNTNRPMHNKVVQVTMYFQSQLYKL
jgi:hypothetical protein